MNSDEKHMNLSNGRIQHMAQLVIGLSLENIHDNFRYFNEVSCFMAK